VTRRVFPLLAAALTAGLLAVPARAPAAGPDGVVPVAPNTDTNQNVGIDQKLGAQIPLDLVFRDENDQPITLRECMNGKVTILVPVYFRCPMLCTQVLNGLLDGMTHIKDMSVGEQFNVITVSMDPKEHGDLGRAKKGHYVDRYGRPGAENGWRFITGKKEAIGQLLDTVGYRFEFDKAFKEYKHPSGIILLTPDGRVSRYFFGVGYDDAPPDNIPIRDAEGKTYVPPPPTWNTLRLSLVEASEGKLGTLADKLTLMCYRFEHLNQGYALQVMNVVRLGGAVTLFAVAGYVTFALWRERRKRVALAATPTGETNGNKADPADGPGTGGSV
jgi:protein SCO1/2